MCMSWRISERGEKNVKKVEKKLLIRKEIKFQLKSSLYDSSIFLSSSQPILQQFSIEALNFVHLWYLPLIDISLW